ncbi:MAG: PepSY domain-containing protein [Clostridia bacterium]|nr:PepSY domain-containing protein [Clostridia bacterium]
MKRLLAIIFTVIFVTSLSACGTDKDMGGNGTDNNNSIVESGMANTASGETKLSADEALDIALKEAGVTKDSISGLENHLDRENGVLVYEVEFRSGNTEYSFDINADTGEVVDRDRDLDY